MKSRTDTPFSRAGKAAPALASVLFLLVGIVQSTSVAAASAGKYISTGLPSWNGVAKSTAVQPTTGLLPDCLNSSVLPRCYSPQQMRTAYDVPVGATGKGRTIVIIAPYYSSALKSDLHLYDQLFGLKDPQLIITAPSGMPSYNSLETALDVETVHALAPDAAIDLMLTSNPALIPSDAANDVFALHLLDAMKYAVDHNLGDVISLSYTESESCFSTKDIQYEHRIYQAARDKNIAVIVAVGDSGAAVNACNADGTISEAQGVNVLASDPLASAVGGTTLTIDATDHYMGETAWNDAGASEATGGGFSTVFARPAYQNGLTNDAHRGLPDIAWNADTNTGVPIVYDDGDGTAPHVLVEGGTSEGAPAWAAIAALANQYAGKRLGYLNVGIDRLLQSASYTRAFHDITAGNNAVSVYLSRGSASPITIPGYSAGPHWDAVTGAGTPDVGQLLPLLKQYVHPHDGSGL